MAETKRKARDEPKDMAKKLSKKKQKHPDSKNLAKKSKEKRSERMKRTGPRLPNSLRKELDRLNPNSSLNSDEDEEINSDEGELYADDVYEYHEGVPQEESKKNRRFDPVENFEYELPQNFKVLSLSLSVIWCFCTLDFEWFKTHYLRSYCKFLCCSWEYSVRCCYCALKFTSF